MREQLEMYQRSYNDFPKPEFNIPSGKDANISPETAEYEPFEFKIT